MKTTISLALVLILCFSIFAGCSNQSEQTPQSAPTNQQYLLEGCKVYDVGKYPNEIAIADPTMDIWVWHDDLDKSIGDECVLLMDDNGTPDYLYDDAIISIEWV